MIDCVMLMLQVRVVDYNQLKGQASQSARKQTGSLAVRDLSTIVKAGDVTETENITTLFVVVDKHTKRDWLDNYETLSDYVVSIHVLLGWWKASLKPTRKHARRAFA